MSQSTHTHELALLRAHHEFPTVLRRIQNERLAPRLYLCTYEEIRRVAAFESMLLKLERRAA